MPPGNDPSEAATGYAHTLYARSLDELGTPRELPVSGGWILERQVQATMHRDAMGCYPLFSCRDWSQLGADLSALRDLVSVTLVVGPMARASMGDPRAVFTTVFPFKSHHLVDLSRSPGDFVSRHHRREARRAASLVEVERCESPREHAGDWVRLYRQLVRTRAVDGPARLSPRALRRQLDVPGLTMFRAIRDDRAVAMVLWFLERGVGYYHLAASDDDGYRSGASYALMAESLRVLADDVAVLDLGGAPGVSESPGHGLARFKAGWATGAGDALLCGRVLDQRAYRELSTGEGLPCAGRFFPRYRAPEPGHAA